LRRKLFQFLTRRGKAGHDLGIVLADPGTGVGPRTTRFTHGLQLAPLVDAPFVVFLETIERMAFAENAGKNSRELARFREAHVHALHTHRTGHVAGIAHEPRTTLTERTRHTTLEANNDSPENFLNRRIKPRSTLVEKVLKARLTQNRILSRSELDR